MKAAERSGNRTASHKRSSSALFESLIKFAVTALLWQNEVKYNTKPLFGLCSPPPLTFFLHYGVPFLLLLVLWALSLTQTASAEKKL